MMRLGWTKRKIDIFMRFSVLRLLFTGALFILVDACDRSDQQIKVYRLVKAPLESGTTEQTTTANSTAATPQIEWELPEGWEKGSPSTMRYASFAATGNNGDKLDISVVTFPGDGGSDVDNVNRWRQQLGLDPVDEGQLNSIVTALQNDELKFSIADTIGPNSRTIAAWVRREGRSWFFKLTGPKDAVEKEKPKFVKFLQSVRFEKNAE